MRKIDRIQFLIRLNKINKFEGRSCLLSKQQNALKKYFDPKLGLLIKYKYFMKRLPSGRVFNAFIL